MLSEQQKLEFVGKTDLFAHLPSDSEGLALISHSAEELDVPAEHVLFEEGDEGDSLYLLVDGKVGIIKDYTQVMTLDQPGICIGEMALIDDEPRSATVKTLTATKLLKIPSEDFYQALKRDFSIARGMFSVLNNKLRNDLEVQMSSIRKEIARQESMRMAAEVQQSLLPSEEIDHPKLATAGYCEPADSVGGDYYDYIYLPGERFAIFLGDVMGHGYHSAMLTAMTKSGLHTQIEFDASMDAVMMAINRVAEQHIRAFIYLTCCCVIIYPDEHKLEYANAGHPPMLLYRAAHKDVIELESQFTPLGLLPTPEDMAYHSETVSWQPDDVLMLYSDGITEAEDSDEEMYGTERLKDQLLKVATLSPAEIKAAILEDLEAYQSGNSPEDDVTLVIVKGR
jgi:phosphoserine phosphatase RsbU/P